MHSYGLHSYGLYSHGLGPAGWDRRKDYTVMAYIGVASIVMGYIVMASMVMAYIGPVGWERCSRFRATTIHICYGILVMAY